ncbi:preprotein translocase subunit YajC [Kocuria massiliensis]|uniref:preprotein translocase subunit YajC n=1 Tax=Kocuria massiliensis TaxID=1926282 RepID=UPI000A1CB37F|nr:preprotein translocase subunit YajC [Kocuria massiliensis]
MLLSTINSTGSLQAAEQGGGGSNFLLLGLMLVVVVVFLVLPMRRQKKMRAQMAERQESMVPGTRVMTQFGVFGTIVSVDRPNNRAVIEVAPKTEITVHLGAVTTVLDDNGQIPGTPEAARAAAEKGVTEPSAESQDRAAQNPTDPRFDSGSTSAENRAPRLNGEVTDGETPRGDREDGGQEYRDDRGDDFPHGSSR